MLSPKQLLTAEQKRLLELFNRLPERDRAFAVDFVEFLAGRAREQTDPEPEPQPQPIPRPTQESVVAAMRRLSATYPMLDKGLILHEASALMGSHIMQGRPAPQVIDDLEALFRRHYERSGSSSQAGSHQDPSQP
jgi:hypothetical protein